MLFTHAFVGTLSSGEILAPVKSRAKLPKPPKAATDVSGLQEAAIPCLALRYPYIR